MATFRVRVKGQVFELSRDEARILQVELNAALDLYQNLTDIILESPFAKPEISMVSFDWEDPRKLKKPNETKTEVKAKP